MTEPILIHIKGHAYSTCLPLEFVKDDTRAWIQAFDHVLHYVVPHRLSFMLHGRGSRVFFREGVPVKKDVDRLCLQLKEQQRTTAPMVSTLQAAA